MKEQLCLVDLHGRIFTRRNNIFLRLLPRNLQSKQFILKIVDILAPFMQGLILANLHEVLKLYIIFYQQNTANTLGLIFMIFTSNIILVTVICF